MNSFQLAFRNIKGSPFKSSLIVICISIITLCCAGGILLVGGAGQNAQTSLDKMDLIGFELVVMPREGSYLNPDLENEIKFGLLSELAAIPGLSAVTPMFRLFYQAGSENRKNAELKIIAINQETDSLFMPLIREQIKDEIQLGDCISGSQAAIPSGDAPLNLDGYDLKLAGRLASTGTSFDKYFFVTTETAREIVHWFKSQNQTREGKFSVGSLYLVKTLPGADLHKLSSQILLGFPGVTIFDSTNFFALERNQMQKLLIFTPLLIGLVILVLFVFTGLAFSLSVNERKREIGVLRAIGFPRSFLLKSFIVEGFIVALAGGVSGLVIFMILGSSFGQVLKSNLGFSLSAVPSVALIGLLLSTLTFVTLSVPLAALLPIWRICHEDPATTLKS